MRPTARDTQADRQQSCPHQGEMPLGAAVPLRASMGVW